MNGTSVGARRRPRRSEGTGPQYQSVADALQLLRTPVPSVGEIARIYRVSVTTAQFARRALHTRRYTARSRVVGAHTIRDGGEGPLWRRVADDLHQRVSSGGLCHQFPPRVRLASEYGVSVHTVNKAVGALVEEGLLNTARGATWVVPGRAACGS